MRVALLHLTRTVLQIRHYVIFMREKKRRYPCQCLSNPARPIFKKDCEACYGSGYYVCKVDNWYIDRAWNVFWLAAVCSTGHCYDKSRNVGRLATARDIVDYVTPFASNGYFNDCSHPSFVLNTVEQQLNSLPQPIILPGFRPIIGATRVLVLLQTLHCY